MTSYNIIETHFYLIFTLIMIKNHTINILNILYTREVKVITKRSAAAYNSVYRFCVLDLNVYFTINNQILDLMWHNNYLIIHSSLDLSKTLSKHLQWITNTNLGNVFISNLCSEVPSGFNTQIHQLSVCNRHDAYNFNPNRWKQVRRL